MKGTIQRIARERLERRDDTRLPTAWFGDDGALAPEPATATVFRDHGGVTTVDHGAPVSILLAGEHPGALAELVAHAEAGARVYVLAPAGWGTGKLEAWIGHCPTVLIRRVPEVPVSGVLRPGAAKIWAGGRHGGAAPWCLRLGAAQADALRQIFLRLFWHDAVDEAWTGDKQLVFRPAAERPFDVPPVGNGACVRLVAAETRLDVVRGAVAHVSADAPPDAVPRRLWIAPSGDHHDRLAALRRGGAEIGWTALDLPDVALVADAGVALLPGARARLRIDLDAAQRADLERILAQPSAWRFDLDVRLGDRAQPGVRFRLPGPGAAAALEPEQKIEVGQVQAEQLRLVPQTTPASWPAPQPLALAVRYRWTVVPPRLPTGAEEDPLVGRWRKLDADWVATLARVRDALDDAENHRGRLRTAFSRLLSGLLGLERTHEKLRKQLDALMTETPSAAGPKGAPTLLDRLTALADEVRKLQGDLDDAERKAREQQEREKQEAAWEARVKTAERELAARRAQLGELESRRPGLAAELAASAAEVASADKDAKSSAPPDSDRGPPRPDKAEANKRADKSQDRRARPNQRTDDSNADKTKDELEQPHKDRLVRERRLSDELTKLDRDRERLKSEVVALARQAAEPFSFTPPATLLARPAAGTGRFVPADAPPRPANAIPEEALPEAGHLRRHRGQRFLVIDTWDLLAAGEAAASRLDARLVGPEQA